MDPGRLRTAIVTPRSDRNIATKGQTGAEAILTVLARSGVEQIFASPGSEWAPLWEALARAAYGEGTSPPYLSVGHEELAVSMAAGYAKSSGRLPAVVLHTTVGALHATMALRAAHHEQIPMVVIAGESIGFGEEEGPNPGGQWLSHLTDLGGPAALVERCVKWAARVPSPVLLPSMVQRACLLAQQSPPGPVFLSVPMEYLFESMTVDLIQTVPAQNPMGDTVALGELAAALLASTRPLIVTEEAGRNPSTVAQLVEVAELLAAPVVETRGSRFMNFPRSHYLHGGFDPKNLIDDADEILLCGVMAPWHPSSRRPQHASGITAMRENPLRTEIPYWGFPIDRLIPGAIEPGLAFLLEMIKANSPGDRGERRSELQQQHESRRSLTKEAATRHRATKPIRPRWAALAVGSALPSGAVVVDETLTSRLGLLELIDLEPGCYFAGAVGGLGTGLGTALGVKAAAPDRLVVCTIGDGSIGYEPALAALAASREHNLPFLMVIMNNLGYLSQKATIPNYFPDGAAVANDHYPGLQVEDSPDYVRIAEAFGGTGTVIVDPGELGPALASAIEKVTSGVFAILDIRLQPVSETAVRVD